MLPQGGVKPRARAPRALERGLDPRRRDAQALRYLRLRVARRDQERHARRELDLLLGVGAQRREQLPKQA